MFYCNKYLLKRISSIQSGYSIRGKIPEDHNGELKIIRMKDIDPENGIDWDNIASINPVSKRTPLFLKQSDIIFSGRGTKVFSVAVDRNIEKIVAAPHFFVINPYNNLVNSFYLSWYINQNIAQKYFKKNAGSSIIINVKRKVLEELPVLLPSLQEQEKITKYIRAIKKEHDIGQKLYRKKNQLLTAIISQTKPEEK